jgi:hypothetical protein
MLCPVKVLGMSAGQVASLLQVGAGDTGDELFDDLFRGGPDLGRDCRAARGEGDTLLRIAPRSSAPWSPKMRVPMTRPSLR